MLPTVNTGVLVACPSNAAHKQLVRLRRYERSDTEGVFVRVDGEADDWFVRMNEDGPEQYPRPSFKCPKCKKPAVYEHDRFQDLLHRASLGNGVVFI